MTNRTASLVPPEPSCAPAVYEAELAETVLEQLMDGRTLLDVCRDDGMPAAKTVRRWLLDDREGFAARYLRARQIGAVAMALQAYKIAAHASTPAQAAKGNAAAPGPRQAANTSSAHCCASEHDAG